MARRDRIYRKAEPAMWSSADFRALSAAPPNGQTLWWWLLSCERTIAIPGVVVARTAIIADDLRWPVKATRKILLDQIVASGMAEVDEEAGLIVLTKALLVDGIVRDTARPTSINQGKSWGSAFASLPRCALRDRLGDRLVEFFAQVGGEIANAFAETSCLPSARRADAKPHAKGDAKAQGERTQGSESEAEVPDLSHRARGRDAVVALAERLHTAHAVAARKLADSIPACRTVSVGGGLLAGQDLARLVDVAAAWTREATAAGEDPQAFADARLAKLVAVRSKTAERLQHVRFWVPSTFWDPDGIAKDLAQTPEQAAAAARAGPGHPRASPRPSPDDRVSQQLDRVAFLRAQEAEEARPP